MLSFTIEYFTRTALLINLSLKFNFLAHFQQLAIVIYFYDNVLYIPKDNFRLSLTSICIQLFLQTKRRFLE